METKKCSFCAEDIALDAVKCKHCGEYQSPEIRDYMQPKAEKVQKWNPGIAALISIFIPGGGHMYKGRVGTGIGLLILTVIGYAILVIPGVILHIISIATAYSGDPYK